MKNLESMVDECYQAYIKDETIVGFDGLLRSKGLGSKRIIKLRNLIYEKYGKEELIKIYRKRLTKRMHKTRSAESYQHTEEWNENIKNKVTESWKRGGEERKELSRKLMLEHCCENSHTPQTNLKRLNSRRDGKGWKPHSEQTKKKISKVFKKKWLNGDYNNRVKSFSSGCQKELESIIQSLGYITKDEYFVNGRPYDVFIKDKNLIIEFNGTYWHLDPDVYDKNYYDKSRDVYAHEIWSRDIEKLDNAKKFGYNVLIVWEKEWTNCKDKIGYVKKLLC